MSKPKLDENVLRMLRSRVFGECTDNGWERTRDYWAEPENTLWLFEKEKLAPHLKQYEPSDKPMFYKSKL